MEVVTHVTDEPEELITPSSISPPVSNPSLERPRETQLAMYIGHMDVMEFTDFEHKLEPKEKSKAIWCFLRHQHHTKLGKSLVKYLLENVHAVVYFGQGSNVEARFADFRNRCLDYGINKDSYRGLSLEEFSAKTGILFLPFVNYKGDKH